jgi:putative FmdB family regulatory protein
MPTYEYLCNQCEHGFEVVQSFTEAAIQVCPKCNGEVRKVYNNVGVVFKGSGFQGVRKLQNQIHLPQKVKVRQLQKMILNQQQMGNS